MKTYLFILMLALSFRSSGQDLELEENKYLGYIYQQQNYLLDDPKGDVLLLWTARQIPQSVAHSLKGKSLELKKYREQKIAELLIKYPEYALKAETENIVVKDYLPYNPQDEEIELEGHQAPFKVKNVVTMLKQVVAEEYQVNHIVPSEGTPHEWSPEIKKELHRKFVIFSRMSKLLVALSRGASSYYMVTGTEAELKAYILTRPENSINLEEMFRASYRINKGDVYLTLLTIENVLSRFWTTPQRSMRAITTKLKDITNFNYQTDKFGAWYHLFGIMLYGYVEGGLKAKTVGTIETGGSLIMGHFTDEKQETYVNSLGGPIGSRIHRFVKKKQYESFKLDKGNLKEDFYMDLDEDFTKRLKAHSSSPL